MKNPTDGRPLWQQGSEMLKWETVEHRGSQGETARLRTPGGWLYKTCQTNGSFSKAGDSLALCFVPIVGEPT